MQGKITSANKGFTLIETMIALGLVLLVGYLAQRTMKAQWQSIGVGKKMGDVEDIRDRIRTKFDCKETIRKLGTDCSRNGPTPVIGITIEGDVLFSEFPKADSPGVTVKHPASKMGEEYRIDGQCHDTGAVIEFDIEIALAKIGQPSLTTARQPLFKTALTCPRPYPTNLAVSTYHACLTDSNGRVKCWGENRHGQLGNGEIVSLGPIVQNLDGVAFDQSIYVDRPSHIQPTPVIVKDLFDVKSLALGGLDEKDGGESLFGITDMEHSCALKNDGSVWCWGSDNQGAIGIGNTSNDRWSDIAAFVTPQKVLNLGGVGTMVQDIVAGFHHNCVRLANNTMKCWGRHCGGELGYFMWGPDIWNPDRLGKFIAWPAALAPVTVRKMAAGGRRTCAIIGTGEVLCWGYDKYGELGLGKTTEYVTWNGPEVVTTLGINQTDDLTIGFHQMCALKKNGKIACTGRNDFGQLGLSNTINQNVNTEIAKFAGSDYIATKVVTGGYHTCAIRNDGTLWCWGRNNFGQIGQPANAIANTDPMKVSLPLSVKDVALGAQSTCVHLTDNSIRCWGSNAKGQLGNAVAAGAGNFLDNPMSSSAIVP